MPTKSAGLPAWSWSTSAARRAIPSSRVRVSIKVRPSFSKRSTRRRLGRRNPKMALKWTTHGFQNDRRANSTSARRLHPRDGAVQGALDVPAIPARRLQNFPLGRARDHARLSGSLRGDPRSRRTREHGVLARSGAVPPGARRPARPPDEEATAIAYVNNEVAGKLARARTFEELMRGALIEEFREVKRGVGVSLAHPEVLMAAACANLSTRSAFSRLYRGEEKVLTQATSRIEDLERKLRHGAGEEALPEELRKFRETRDHVRREAQASNLRAHDVVKLKTAIDDVLQKFDLKVLDTPVDDAEASEPFDEADSAGDDAFWNPSIGRILAIIEIESDGRGALQTGTDGLAHLRLEPWELQAIRRMVADGGEPKNDRDQTLLRSVALRVKAEEENELLRSTADGPRSINLLRRARGSIARAPGLDGKISLIIRVAHESGLSRHVRAWTRTRFRLLRAVADLWLMQDRPLTDRRTN